MRLRPLLLILAITPLATAAPAPDTYFIRIGREPAAGQRCVVKRTEKFASTTVVTYAFLGQSSDPQKTNTEEDVVYTETILDGPAKKGDGPKKFKRAYTRARRTTDGKEATLPYENRTVVFELHDDKYHATVEGKPALDSKVLDELAQKESGTPAAPGADAKRLFFPKGPVKVGQTWALDGQELVKALPKNEEVVLHPKQSSGEGKLVKAYVKGGKQYGVIELRLKLAFKRMGNLTFEKPATHDTALTLDGVIDGSSAALTTKYASKMRGHGTITEKGQTITVEVNADQSGTQELSPEK